MKVPAISKSKYLAGLQCPKLLWAHYNAKHWFPPRYRQIATSGGNLRTGVAPHEWEVSAKTIQRDIDYLKYELAAPISNHVSGA